MAQKSPVIALLSIKPIYAYAILEGRKKVEFRKRPFKRPVSHVVIYASSPVQRVIGWFETTQTDQMSPNSLWSRFAEIGEISRQDFRQYYGNAESGVAIHVRKSHSLKRPLPLRSVSLAPPPQSFSYLPHSAIGRLQKQANSHPPKRYAVKKAVRKTPKKRAK